MTANVGMAQSFDPPKVKAPDEATIQLIRTKTTALQEVVAQAIQLKPTIAADLEIYVKAAEYIVRHQEWLTADAGKQTLAVLDQGHKRADAVKAGQTPWLNGDAKGYARGYRSKIDGSVQPYGVQFPTDYGKTPNKTYRLDILLHGRDSTLTEVKFLNQHNGKDTPKTQDFIQLVIYGRGNNAYRWAGEQDVLEALNDLLKREEKQFRRPMIDPHRIVLKGFSMGGAGTWHLGLRRPGMFAALQPGAGFTTTHGYIAGLPNPLPPHQEACLKIYDALNYAPNAFNVPIVAYSGEIDKQRLAAENIEKRLKELQLTQQFTHLIGPGLEHKFPPEWQQKAEAELQKYVGQELGRKPYPKTIHFHTFTPMHGECAWLEVEALEKQYQQADVRGEHDGTSIKLTTKNVRVLRVRLPETAVKTITLDGSNFAPNAKAQSTVTFDRKDGKWALGYPTEHFKRGHLCGPIDHAFTDKFICVVGTGKPLNADMERAANAQLARFRNEWDKFMRGILIVKKDTEVTRQDMTNANVILFGDPSSNRLISDLCKDTLPLTWDAKKLVFGGQEYDASTHLPMMIYPNKYGRYVVLNSGHTFHAAEFRGTNAQLYPRLGDYAIVKPGTDANFEVITAGLFDENWKIAGK